jgi:hypothetical protein
MPLHLGAVYVVTRGHAWNDRLDRLDDYLKNYKKKDSRGDTESIWVMRRQSSWNGRTTALKNSDVVGSAPRVARTWSGRLRSFPL